MLTTLEMVESANGVDLNQELNDAPYETLNRYLREGDPQWVLVNYRFTIKQCPAAGLLYEKLIREAKSQDIELTLMQDILLEELYSEWKDLKPADAYRKYAPALRLLDTRESRILLKEIMSDQNQPFNDLDNPDFIDGYTGAVDPEYEMPEAMHFSASETLSLAEHHDMPVEYAQEIVKAQEGFNASDGLDNVIYDEYDVHDPKYFEIYREMNPTEDMWELITTMQRWIAGKKYPAGALQACMRTMLAQGNDAKDVLAAFYMLQQEREDLVDDLLSAVPYENGNDIHNLADFADIYGEQIIENLPDDLLAKNPGEKIDLGMLDRMEEDMITEYVVKNIKANDITRDPYFLEAEFRAALHAKALVWYDDKGQRHNAPSEAGWEAWRQHRSQEGNKAFHKAIKEGKTPKEAMKAFWKIANKPSVTAVDPRGLTLSSGRHVNWQIAAIKVRNEEIDLNKDDKIRLRELLQQRNWGAALMSLLE